MYQLALLLEDRDTFNLLLAEFFVSSPFHSFMRYILVISQKDILLYLTS